MLRRSQMSKGSGFKRPERVRPPMAPLTPIRRGVVSRCDEAGPAQPKTAPKRKPHLLAMARGEACLFQIQGICNQDRRTTVACHENQGKGMAIKASDARSAVGCSACHEAYDRGPELREVKRGWFLVAHGRQVEVWQRIAGDMSRTPRERRAADWALQLIFGGDHG